MKYLTSGVYLLLVFIVAFPFLVLPRIVKITKLECYSQYGICGNALFSLIDGSKGKSLKDAKTEVGKQLKNDGLIEKYSFTFKFPGTLRVDIILKKAKFALSQKDSVEVVLIDKDGNVLQTTDKTNLPGVVASGDFPKVGEKVSEDRLFALNLIYSLNFLYQVGSGEIVSDGLVVNLPSGPQVVFPLAGDQEILLGSLKLVLSKAYPVRVNRGIMMIDLRFKNPIIR